MTTMWYDSFDGDLFKLYPIAKNLIGNLGDVPLFTHGSHWREEKTLGHPAVWNGYDGMQAFFGFKTPAKPPSHWTDNPIIGCTFEQAVRDAWCHDYILFVEREKIWNAFELQTVMMDLLFDARGTHKLSAQAKEERLMLVDASLCRAVLAFDSLAQRHGVLTAAEASSD